MRSGTLPRTKTNGSIALVAALVAAGSATAWRQAAASHRAEALGFPAGATAPWLPVQVCGSQRFPYALCARR